MSDRTPNYEVELMDGTVLPIYFTPTTLGLRDEPHALPIIATHTLRGGEVVFLSSGVNEKQAMDCTLYLLGGGPAILEGKVYQEWVKTEHRLAPIKQVRKLTT